MHKQKSHKSSLSHPPTHTPHLPWNWPQKAKAETTIHNSYITVTTIEAQREEPTDLLFCYLFPYFEWGAEAIVIIVYLYILPSTSGFCFFFFCSLSNRRRVVWIFPSYLLIFKNFMVKRFLSLLKFIIWKMRPREFRSEWEFQLWMSECDCFIYDRTITTTTTIVKWKYE